MKWHSEFPWICKNSLSLGLCLLVTWEWREDFKGGLGRELLWKDHNSSQSWRTWGRCPDAKGRPVRARADRGPAAPHPGRSFHKAQLASGCAGERLVCKKQEVINLCYLQLMRQKYCSDVDIMLMMSDMETSNTLTDFKEEQIGNEDLWRKTKCSRFMRSEERRRQDGRLLGRSWLHAQGWWGEAAAGAIAPGTASPEPPERLCLGNPGHGAHGEREEEFHPGSRHSAATATLTQSRKEQRTTCEEPAWNLLGLGWKGCAGTIGLMRAAQANKHWWGRE